MNYGRTKIATIVGTAAVILIAIVGGCARHTAATTLRPSDLNAPVVVNPELSPKSAAAKLAMPGALGRPSASATHAAETPLITADPDDPAWRDAAVVSDFSLPLRTKPIPGPALPTQVRLLWDADHLYLRFTCVGPAPYSPFGNQRDAKQYQGDAVECFLDPVGDGKQYFEIQLSAANGVLDQNTLITADAKCDADGRLTRSVLDTNYWPDPGYDMKGLRTACRVTGAGATKTWTADLAIPAAAALHRTGRKTFEPMSLRMNFMRYHWTGPVEDGARKLIPLNWSPVVFGCPHQSPAAMGTVNLINDSIQK
jgi:hypothetical protein